MEYEGSIGLVTRKMIFFIADFQVLGLFMTKNMIRAIKKFHLSCAVAGASVIQNLGHAYSLLLIS
jgi:hypothetical protein